LLKQEQWHNIFFILLKIDFKTTMSKPTILTVLLFSGSSSDRRPQALDHAPAHAVIAAVAAGFAAAVEVAVRWT
jgi:hypothetical protein